MLEPVCQDQSVYAAFDVVSSRGWKCAADDNVDNLNVCASRHGSRNLPGILIDLLDESNQRVSLTRIHCSRAINQVSSTALLIADR